MKELGKLGLAVAVQQQINNIVLFQSGFLCRRQTREFSYHRGVLRQIGVFSFLWSVDDVVALRSCSLYHGLDVVKHLSGRTNELGWSVICNTRFKKIIF